jgi:hypothetical protein
MRPFKNVFAQPKPGALIVVAIVASVCLSNSACLWAAGTATYIQSNSSTPQSPESSVATKFTGAQTAGDLNVVVAGWNDGTATVKSVTDTNGNIYTLAVGPTVISGAASQSIYYATNIAAAAAGGNTVTVTFSTAASYADIRILEYSGVSSFSPVDVTAASSGNSATSSSGSATTTNASDLIIGANLVATTTSGPGSGFTERMITSPDGDIAEDEMAAATGSFSATAPLSSSGYWIMQMVAFKVGDAISACDLNADGVVNVEDAQMASDMDPLVDTMICTAPGGYCNSVFWQNVLNAALGQACSLTFLGVPSSPINVGNVTVGTTGVQSTSLTATGSGSTIISQVTVTPATFTVSGLTLPYTLSAGNSAPFSVSFTPTGTGTVSGTVAFTTNSNGEALNSPLSVPLSGTGVTVTAHSASLSWTASTTSGVSTYNVYRITSSSSTAPATPYPSLVSGLPATGTGAVCSGTACSYTDTSVTAGTSYWYYATAVSNGVESGPSNSAQAVIPTS